MLIHPWDAVPPERWPALLTGPTFGQLVTAGLVDGYPVVVDDPDRRLLPGIRGVRIDVREVLAKMKYGGNKSVGHRRAVAARLRERGQGSTSRPRTGCSFRRPSLAWGTLDPEHEPSTPD